MARRSFYILFAVCWLDYKCNKVGADVSPNTIRNECMIPRVLKGCEKTGYTEKDTYFYLFTRKNPDYPEQLHDCGRKLPRNTNFDSRHPTEIIIHGFFVLPCFEAWMREIKDQLLKRGSYNVILIHWENYAFFDYFNVQQGVKIAANETVELINNIKEQTGADADNFHIIGHSLGAHFAAFIGQATKVKRITGLDPAGPGYYDLPPSERLDKTDAEYVDIIHTGAGRCLPQFGYLYPLGHDDFYVNGGQHQISCVYSALESLVKGDVVYASNSLINIPTICSHVQSQQYYKVSINPGDCQFVGKKCNNYKQALQERCNHPCRREDSNCAVMGMDWLKFYNGNKNHTRIFSVKTSIKCPFCIPDKSMFPSAKDDNR